MPVVLQAGPVRRVSLELYTIYSDVVHPLAHIRGLGALRPGSNGPSQIFEAQASLLCLPAVLVSDCAH